MTQIEHFDVYLVTSNNLLSWCNLIRILFNAPSIDHAPAKYQEKYKQLFLDLQIEENLIIYEIPKIPDELILFLIFASHTTSHSSNADIRRKSTLRKSYTLRI